MATSIHPTAIVANGAQLGVDVTIGAFSVIGGQVTIGDNTYLHSSVVIDGRTSLGSNNQVFPFTCLGTPPQHVKYEGEESTLTIGNNNLIREHVTMHKGAKVGAMHTEIGSNNMFMVGSHVAHDCILGDHILMANNAILGGHVEVGDNVYIGGGTAVQQFVRIGHSTIIGGKSAVIEDVIPFARAVGNRCRLVGINVIGLRRQGFSKTRIADLRAAWHLLFKDKDSGTFKERLAEVKTRYGGHADVKEIIAFIDAKGKQPIMQAGEDIDAAA